MNAIVIILTAIVALVVLCLAHKVGKPTKGFQNNESRYTYPNRDWDG